MDQITEDGPTAWARHDPNNEIWRDAEWTDLDASAMMLIHQNGNILIYWHGNPNEKNILIPARYAEKIAYYTYKRFEAKLTK